MDSNEYRVRSKKLWDSMARGWDERRDNLWKMSRKVGEWLVENLAPQPGQTVLELAAGVGDTGFAAAAVLGEAGRLISTDFSPAMVEAATRRGAELGLANVEYRVMDAERMEIADDSVDGVLCRWGYMLMADPLVAFKETRRVLRKGGKLCFACFTGAQQNPWAAIPGKVLVQRGHMPPPQPEAPGIFALSDTGRVTSLLQGAGFQVPKFKDIPMHFYFETFDEYWYFLTEIAGAISVILKSLEDAEMEIVRADVEAGVRPFQTEKGIDIPAVSLGAVTS